jgi:hypothetical protein
MKKKSKSSNLKAALKLPVVVELPTNMVDMENYVEQNRVEINNLLVDSFDYAVKKNFGGIEVFCFKDSNYVVLVSRKDFQENLQCIFDYSLKEEQFETCAKAKAVMDRLNKFSFVMNCKKIKSK